MTASHDHITFIPGVVVECFKEDADIAFATNMFIRSGFTGIGFALSAFICTRIKLFTGFALAAFATIGYITLEICLRKGFWLKQHRKRGLCTNKNEDGNFST